VIVGKKPARDERPRHAPIRASVRACPAHTEERPIVQPKPPRALHVQYEQGNRVGYPRQLEAAPGERPALDVGARGIGLEAPTLNAAGEAAARARLIERAGLDVEQVRRAPVQRVTE